MPEYRCEREDCGRWFAVDPDDVGETVRCSHCGHKQTIDPGGLQATPDEADREADRIAASASPDRQPDHALQVEGGATVTITIEIDVEPNGGG